MKDVIYDRARRLIFANLGSVNRECRAVLSQLVCSQLEVLTISHRSRYQRGIVCL